MPACHLVKDDSTQIIWIGVIFNIKSFWQLFWHIETHVGVLIDSSCQLMPMWPRIVCFTRRCFLHEKSYYIFQKHVLLLALRLFTLFFIEKFITSFSTLAISNMLLEQTPRYIWLFFDSTHMNIWMNTYLPAGVVVDLVFY